MGNVIDKLEYIAGTKAAIKTAIEAKGVTVGEAVTFRQYADKIGEIETREGDLLVRFIDYDGTILKEQRVNSGEDATAPTVPTHDNLTFQGWNAVFTSVTRSIDVVAIYITTDGKTYLYVTVTPSTGLSPILYLNKATTDELTVNWGDGKTSTSSASGSINLTNTYAAKGDYVITITCAGSYGLGDVTSSNPTFGTTNYKYILTDVMIGNNVTSIGLYAFTDCYSLASISIPTGVTSIRDYAFNGCYSLASISIPTGVTSIGANAFTGCYSLASISIPTGVTSIGANAFNGCYSLTSISIPTGVTSIGLYAFTGCYSLASISIPTGVTSIGDYAFTSCYSLASISIPTGVTSIGLYAFYNCYSLASISIPTGVTSIGDYAFYGCYSLASISIPTGVTSIGANAFNGCYSLASISIPTGVTSIGANAFRNCYSLTSISIPAGVTSIGLYAFYGCYSLVDYQILATTPTTLSNTNAFGGINLITKIYVPDASVSAYKAATNWITYANYIYPISERP